MADNVSSVDIWIRTSEAHPPTKEGIRDLSWLDNPLNESIGDLTASEDYEGLENEVILSQDRPVTVPRNILSIPKFCIRRVWKFIKLSFGCAKSQQWYEIWDDSTLPSSPSVRGEGSIRRPPIVIEDGGVPSDIVISHNNRVSLQKRYLRKLKEFWTLAKLSHFHNNDCDASGSFSQQHFLGSNQVVV